jgi:hypothetical protein
MDKRQQYKKLTNHANICGTVSIILALGVAGSDDAREFATAEERAHLHIPSPAVTYTMSGASIISFAAAFALIRKRNRLGKEK